MRREHRKNRTRIGPHLAQPGAAERPAISVLEIGYVRRSEIITWGDRRQAKAACQVGDQLSAQTGEAAAQQHQPTLGHSAKLAKAGSMSASALIGMAIGCTPKEGAAAAIAGTKNLE
jgi:hypothetical protein